MRRPLLSALILTLALSSLSAQTILQTSNSASSGSESAKNIARDSAGNLWALSVLDLSGNHPLLLQTSTDNGATWTSDPFVFNDAASGMTGTPFTSGCAIAVDDTGTIHALWSVYSYPSVYRQYYRQYNPALQTSSAIRDVTAHVGATQSIRTTAMAIALDASNTVYIITQGTSAWVEAITRSNLPYASDLNFTRIGNISPSASSQSTRMAIDANGYIHFSFYRNIGAGEYHHRYYDPATSTWSVATLLGNTTPTNDQFGDIAADALGNVHAVYIMDDAGAAAGGPKLRYKRWDVLNGWSPELIVSDIPAANFGGIANGRIFALGCDEATGTSYLVHRDLANTGSLELASMPLSGPSFVPVQSLTPGSLSLHAYYTPTIRGSLYPAFNNTGTDIDITWQNRPTSTPPFSLYYARVSLGAPSATITLSAPAIIGQSTTVDLFSPSDPNASYVCGFALGSVPGIPVGDGRIIPVNYDPLLLFSLEPANGIFFNTLGVLSGSGDGSVIIAVPFHPPLVNLTIYSAFVTSDPTSVTGIGTVSPSLAITIQ